MHASFLRDECIRIAWHHLAFAAATVLFKSAKLSWLSTLHTSSPWNESETVQKRHEMESSQTYHKWPRGTMRSASPTARQVKLGRHTRLPRAPRAEFEPRLNVEAAYGTGFALISMAVVSSEFWKRIAIQRRCSRCQGSGLVALADGRSVKCPECGGMFPWYSWKRFFQSTPRVGDGGPLRQPKGQNTVLYKVDKEEEKDTKE